MKVVRGLKTIAPRWAQKIKSKKTMDELLLPCVIDSHTLDIKDYCNCIVGEANNFSAFYQCEICNSYSMNLFINTDCKGIWYEYLLQFIEHWKEFHV